MNMLRVDTIRTLNVLRAPAVPKADYLRVWARVNQTGTMAVTSSYAVSSIADGGVGITACNFTNPMFLALGYSGIVGSHKVWGWTGNADGLMTPATAYVYAFHAENNAYMDSPNFNVMISGMLA